MAKRKIWINFIHCWNSHDFRGFGNLAEFLASEINWYTAGVILSAISGLGLLFEMYFSRNK